MNESVRVRQRERERGKREQSGGYDDGDDDDDKRIEKQQQAKQCGRRGDVDDVTVNCCCYCFLHKRYIYIQWQQVFCKCTYCNML